ncbi:MAG: YciI family protein [Actinomycetota bacterium]
MKRFIIQFNDGDMRVPDDQWQQVADDSHAVVREAKEAGVWVFGGGFFEDRPWVVTEDLEITDGPLRPSQVRLGGFSVINVESEEQANYWASKIARSCRCPQEVREMIWDDESTN